MKMKFALALLLMALVAGAAVAAPHKVGLLSKLNMTEKEFQEHMDAEMRAGNWTVFTAGEAESLQFKFYDSLSALQMALNAGEIGEIYLPTAVGEYLLNTTPGYAVISISRAAPGHFSFGFRKDKDSTLLKDRFNDALLSMKADGTLAIFQAKYVLEPGVDEPEPVKFEKFNGEDTIKVAVTGDLPPLDFMTANGTPAGFNTAVIAEIGKRLRLNIELVSIASGARAAALASRRVDAVFWFQFDHGPDKQADVPDGVALSEPYYAWNEYLHIRKK